MGAPGAEDDQDGRLAAMAATFDTLFAGAPLGIGIFDRQLRHVRVNPVLEEMNARSADELVGRTPSEVNGDVGRQAEALYRRVMESGAPMRDVRLTGAVSARPGQQRHWNVSFHPVRQDGEVAGLCVIVADVTAEQELADALAASEERHRTLAEDLQRSLLPPTSLVLPGAVVAAAYRPAAATSSVGGDFYDVVRVGADRVALVIGDVQGKGPVAASLTAAVRFAVRTALVTAQEPSPSGALRAVNDVLLNLDAEERLCTAACVLLERCDDAAWTLRSASAGHPLPLVLRAGDGAVTAVGGHGTLLGAVAAPELVEGEAVLRAGDALVLHTDGVTEARAPGGGELELFGEERLGAALTAVRGATAAGVVAAVEAAVSAFAGGGASDDLALLVLTADGGASP